MLLLLWAEVVYFRVKEFEVVVRLKKFLGLIFIFTVAFYFVLLFYQFELQCLFNFLTFIPTFFYLFWFNNILKWFYFLFYFLFLYIFAFFIFLLFHYCFLLFFIFKFLKFIFEIINISCISLVNFPYFSIILH